MIQTQRQFLSETYLRERVPAIFAGSPVSEVSNRYTFVPTFKVISNLKKLGWYPTYAKMNKNKKSLEHGQHMIRFSQKDNPIKLGDSEAELIYVGSHDRSKKIFFGIGGFRAFCTNGMVVFDNSMPNFNFFQKHMSVDFKELEKIMKEIVTQFQVLSLKVKTYQTINLTEVQKDKFAYVARNAYWGDQSIIEPKLLLQTRRTEDEKNDLWTIFNVLQENITKGGIHYSGISERSGRMRNRTTKGVRNVSRDLSINQKLWAIMAAFAINERFI